MLHKLLDGHDLLVPLVPLTHLAFRDKLGCLARELTIASGVAGEILTRFRLHGFDLFQIHAKRDGFDAFHGTFPELSTAKDAFDLEFFSLQALV